MEVLTLSLDEIQPSQLYINQAKLLQIENYLDSNDKQQIEPLPIKKIGQTIFFTDGHTRAFSLWKQGIREVKVYWDKTELDWFAYFVCIDWCQRAGINKIGDLSERMLAEKEYQQLWLNRCQNMRQKLINHLDSYIKIQEVFDPQLKSKICQLILRKLPEWFGLEKANQDYTLNVKETDFLAVYIGNNPIGFVSVKDHNPFSSELYVLGIFKEFHQRGIGRRLIEKVEKDLTLKQKRFLTVKTLSYSHPDKHYQKTRDFYQAMGFYPIEEFKTLWGEANPCLLMLKVLQ